MKYTLRYAGISVFIITCSLLLTGTLKAGLHTDFSLLLKKREKPLKQKMKNILASKHTTDEEVEKIKVLDGILKEIDDQMEELNRMYGSDETDGGKHKNRRHGKDGANVRAAIPAPPPLPRILFAPELKERIESTITIAANDPDLNPATKIEEPSSAEPQVVVTRQVAPVRNVTSHQKELAEAIAKRAKQLEEKEEKSRVENTANSTLDDKPEIAPKPSKRPVPVPRKKNGQNCQPSASSHSTNAWKQERIAEWESKKISLISMARDLQDGRTTIDEIGPQKIHEGLLLLQLALLEKIYERHPDGKAVTL